MIRTDKWLDEHFPEPLEIVKKFMHFLDEDDPERLYEYLQGFGMYSPNRRTKEAFDSLKKKEIWKKTADYLAFYRKKWKGSNPDIYIFPISSRESFFAMEYGDKSGVSFTDRMFLFVSPAVDDKELEALFVHEYHHICRIQKQRKSLKDYTLLDSLVLEGLAEQAVEASCGKKYRSKWCTYYTRKEILLAWNKYFKEKLELEKENRLHDRIFYGGRAYPRMIGYSVGYEIISHYYSEKKFNIEYSFTAPSEKFLSEWEINLS